MNDNIFRQNAKTIVDRLFETKAFRADLTRDDMNRVEDLIHYCMKSEFEMNIKAQKLLESLNKDKD